MSGSKGADGAVGISLGRSVKAVAWSFFGVRKGRESEQDIAAIQPLHLIVIGIGAALLFVLSLMLFVNWVVAA